MKEVAIIGIGQSKFGKYPDRTVNDLGREAVFAAIKDANISPKDIQFAYSSRLYDAMVTGQGILKEVGIRGIEIVNIENACSGGATAFRGAWKEIANDQSRSRPRNRKCPVDSA